MVTERKNYNQDEWSKVLQSVEKAQKLQDDRIKFGLDHVNLYVEDVEGNWLETWDEDEDNVPLEANNLKTNKDGQPIVQVGQWFHQVFEAGWHAVEEVLGTQEPELALFSFRSVEVQRAKLINFGTQLLAHPIALIVKITEENKHKINIILQIQPTDNATYLPEGLQLILVSPSGEFLHTEQAGDATNLLEVGLDGKQGEGFRVQVALNDFSVTEDFVI